MTGYGKSEGSLENKKFSVEIRSLNSKQIDMNTRMPSVYREHELSIRKQIAKELGRGKVEFSLMVEHTGLNTNNTINHEMVNHYLNDLEQLNPSGDSSSLLSIAMRLPDVFKKEKENIDPKEWSVVEQLIEEAIAKLKTFRMNEGNVLSEDFKLRIQHISSHLFEIKNTEKDRVQKVKNRLQSKLEELEIKIDENRYEQELIYYLEKFDITEEIIRLENHLEYFVETMNSDHSEGKKLSFICQEIGREINTIGSKSNDSKMQKLVIGVKDELEKIKEQMLNVL